MPNCFSEQTSLTKLNFELLLPNISKGHIQEDEAHKDNLLTHTQKLKGKYKKKTKILTHVLGLNEEQSSNKSDDEERNQPTVERKFEESWQEKRPTKRKRDRDTYLSPPSKKVKFEIKMKSKENTKTETPENKIKGKKNRFKTINNIVDSLKSLQRQIKDPKFLLNENEAYSIFAKEKVLP